MVKQIIRLTESDLKKIVKESINKILDINDVNFDDLTIEELKAGYKDFREVLSPTIDDNPLYSDYKIKEAVGDFAPPDKVVVDILKKYQLPDRFGKKVEANHKIYIYLFIANIGINDKLIESDMNKFGYFLSTVKDHAKVNGMQFSVLQFEPYSQMQNDETDNIKNMCKTLYHWTPAYNINDIFKNGLLPSHKNDLFNYPMRTYLIYDTSSPDEMLNLGERLCLNNKNPNNNGSYALLAIDIKSLDDSIRLYYDPNSRIGIYTEQIIPPNCLKLLNVRTFRTTIMQP